ncbi:saponin hydrolase precursor [Durotheca rogersii]|uniref:saponin hydrolase precursor n=1 Tax=Durotheca rogersii TaxID=419775 RepID=UPI00221FDCB6|nr:saponin hydrolase precursor [Durotheca rogersii]KAI5867892.1 saponin hydrolase precursor [Durotheca rogersii]
MYVSDILIALLQTAKVASSSAAPIIPPPPQPEPIDVTELPLPPVSGDSEGSCTPGINPLRTGCIFFLPDDNHVIARVRYAGAPAVPDPASIYSGDQIILTKTDGTSFPDGSSFKCITCGVPESNTKGRTEGLDYPQAFRDGKRILAGTNVIDCGEFDLASDNCTPKSTHVYAIRWNTATDGAGEGGPLRELHQHAYVGRFVFDPSLTTSLPLAPRYDLTNVSILFADSDRHVPLLKAITVGEFWGFSGTGKEATYVGYPRESSSIDVFAVDLVTGDIRRLTSHPEYCDPIDISADDEWIAIMDMRGTNRQMFLAGMRDVPPITDLLTATVTSSTRNDGDRRFFQPYLLDRHGDRGDYYGQQMNAAGDGSPGSVNDPMWNGTADPKFSFDTTRLVYRQSLVIAPACGGNNSLPCPDSTEPGGRTQRAMIARFTSRRLKALEPVVPLSDVTPWGTPYEPGYVPSPRLLIPGGSYTLRVAVAGSARVDVALNGDGTVVHSIAVTYDGFTDDGVTFLNGAENVTVGSPVPTLSELTWFSDLA